MSDDYDDDDDGDDGDDENYDHNDDVEQSSHQIGWTDMQFAMLSAFPVSLHDTTKQWWQQNNCWRTNKKGNTKQNNVDSKTIVQEQT